MFRIGFRISIIFQKTFTMDPREGEENRESVLCVMDESNGGSKDDGLEEVREDYLRTSEENTELRTNGCNGDGEFTLEAENLRRNKEFECCRGKFSEIFVEEGSRDEKFGKKSREENDGDDLAERLGNENDGDDLAESLGKENEVDDRRELDAYRESEFANGWHEALQQPNCGHGIGKKDPKLQTFSFSLVSGLRLLKDWRSLDRCISASAKGFAIGAGLKGGLALFSILVRFKRRSSSARMVGDGIRTNSDAISVALKETLRYGLFLGTFAGTFASVDEAIAAFGGRARTARWRSLLAGGIAGPSMLLTGLNTQHTSLAVYILMRASVLAARCGIKSEKFGYLCRPLTWTYGDVFLMCLSSSQILSAYILNQDSLPSTYRSFLNKHGGKDPIILKAIKELASCMPLTSLAGVEKYYKSNGVDIKLDPNIKIPCSIVHANQSCVRHAILFFVQAYARALPVYVPVYLIPALIVHRQGLLKEPCSIFGKTLFGTARSSLFLSVYCSSAWTWTCLLFRVIKKCSIPAVAAGTFPTGLALLIEKKSRRMEIALYCFARALESFFTNTADAGLLPRTKKLKRVDVILFSLSTAVIMHCYAQERDVFRSKYLNVLDWVFGVPHDIEYAIDQIHSKVSITKKPEHIL